MRVETLVVDGPLAMRMARLQATEDGRSGLQIVDMPSLAARLAGGFLRPARDEEVEIAVAAALAEGDFTAIEGARMLPGMVRAAKATLHKLWRSAVVLCPGDRGGQAADVAELDRRVRALLPRAALAPPDLARAAMERVRSAPTLLGAVAFSGAEPVAPVWRPLVGALTETLAAAGEGAVGSDAGRDEADLTDALARARVVVCPDLSSEALEAVRWARGVLASGVRPRDVAIVASDTSPYDERMMALVAESRLPIHFSHGVAALATPEGQTCAALADLVSGGLSQDRVRRLLPWLGGGGGPLGDLPRDALRGVPRDARLDAPDRWTKALATASEGRGDGFDPRVLAPWFELMAAGPPAASRIGAALLRSGTLALWARALRRAPAEALESALADLRVADGRDPGACVVWAPVRHLAEAPRLHARLLGLASGSWPRRSVADALLPERQLDGRRLEERPLTARDRSDFAVVVAAASHLVLSRAKRTAQGRMLTPSPLLPENPTEEIATRSAPAAHAISEADRLFSRPEEAAVIPHVAAALACARSRRSAALSAHDGAVRADHPALARAFSATQSASSLTLLLSDPQAYVWRYALGWRPTLEEVDASTLDGRSFGELVHEILAAAVRALEPDPGLAGATPEAFEAAVVAAANRVGADWPLRRATPPRALWDHAVAEAAAMACSALSVGRTSDPGTRSWSELAFGVRSPGTNAAPPGWDASSPVEVPGTRVSVAGSIDRLDLRADGAVRLTDYKTVPAPAGANRARLRSGSELQRVVYAFAATANLPGLRRVESRLVFLAHEPPRVFAIERLDEAVATLADHLRAAERTLRSGRVHPGHDARADHNPWRLALPASTETYFAIKGAALDRASADLAPPWPGR